MTTKKKIEVNKDEHEEEAKELKQREERLKKYGVKL